MQLVIVIKSTFYGVDCVLFWFVSFGWENILMLWCCIIILLLINQYNSSTAKSVIAKTMNRLGISHGYFIRFWLLHHIL